MILEPMENKDEIRFEIEGEEFVLKGPWATSRKRECVEDQIRWLLDGFITDLTHPSEIDAYRVGAHLTDEAKETFQKSFNKQAEVPAYHLAKSYIHDKRKDG